MSTLHKTARNLNIDARDVERLLARAGWSSNHTGSHIVLHKPGNPAINLANPLGPESWKNVERALGLQAKQLFSTSMRGRGRMSAEDYRERFELALTFHSAGFPSLWVIRYTGLSTIYEAHTHAAVPFSPAIIEALGVDESLKRYAVGVYAEAPSRGGKRVKMIAQERGFVPPLAESADTRLTMNELFPPREPSTTSEEPVVTATSEQHQQALPTTAPKLVPAGIAGDIGALAGLLGDAQLTLIDLQARAAMADTYKGMLSEFKRSLSSMLAELADIT